MKTLLNPIALVRRLLAGGLLLLCFHVCSGGARAQVAQTVISTVPAWTAGGYDQIATFDTLPGDTPTVGETFVAPAGVTALNYFTFYLQGQAGSQLTIQGEVFNWFGSLYPGSSFPDQGTLLNGSGTGGSLYTSAPYNYVASGGWDAITIAIPPGAVTLTPGNPSVMDLTVIGGNGSATFGNTWEYLFGGFGTPTQGGFNYSIAPGSQYGAWEDWYFEFFGDLAFTAGFSGGSSSMSASARLEGPGAGSDSVVLAASSASTTWTATSDSAWLYFNNNPSDLSESGMGSGDVIFNYALNTGGTQAGTVTITTSDGQSLQLNVTQAGFAYTYDTFAAAMNLPPTAPATSPAAPLDSSGLQSPTGVAVDAAGDVYFADSSSAEVYMWVPPPNQTTRPLVFSPTTGLVIPQGVAVDGAGNVYVADSGDDTIKVWSAGTPGSTAFTTAFTMPPLGTPSSVAVDAAGNVYVADAANGVIYKGTPGSSLTTLFSQSSGFTPVGVAVDAAGNVYIADIASDAIEELTAGAGPLMTLISGVGGPTSVAVDVAGNVYFGVADAIEEWTPENSTTFTALIPSSAGYAPAGVAVDVAGNVYFTDSDSLAIEELPYALVDPTPGTEPESPAGGSDSLQPVLAATASPNNSANPDLSGPFTPTSDSMSWLRVTGTNNGVVSFAFTPNQTTSSRTGNLNVLGAAVPVTQGPGTAPVFGSCDTPPLGIVNWWPGQGTPNDIVGGDNAMGENNATPQPQAATVAYESDFNLGDDLQEQQAFSFDGTYFLATPNEVTNPQNFTLECWFKTTTTQGGVLIGFSQDQSDTGGGYDRFIYMDDNGYLHFGVWEGYPALANSPFWYNDGNWHHVAVTISTSSGSSMYVDGALVANNPNATAGQNYDGWWRIGEDNINGWPSQPASSYINGESFFTGAIAEVSIYDRPLPQTEIQALYNAGSAGKCQSALASGTLALGATSRLEGPGGGNDSVVLAAAYPSTGWTVSVDSSWLSIVSPASLSGTGSATVIFNCQPQVTGGATQTGNIIFTRNDGGQTLKLPVTQAGAAYTYDTFTAMTPPVTPLVPPMSGLTAPTGVAVDGSGNVYIADSGNSSQNISGGIDEWTYPNGGAGLLPIPPGTPSPPSLPPLNPQCVAVDAMGNIFIGDTGNGAIEEWTSGSPPAAFNTIISPGQIPNLGTIAGIAVDAADNLYIVDSQNSVIYQWQSASGVLMTLPTETQFWWSPYLVNPQGVAVDAAGNVYVADTGNSAVEELTPGGGVWTPVVFPATIAGGILTTPTGVAVDGAGNVYIADAGNSGRSISPAIFEWVPANAAAITLVSSGLTAPAGVAVDSAGDVYIADPGVPAVEELPYAFVNPTPITESPSGTPSGGSDSLPPVLPTTVNLNLSGPFAPTFTSTSTGSETLGLAITSASGGVVYFNAPANYTSSTETGNFLVLGETIPITQAEVFSGPTAFFGNPPVAPSFGGPDNNPVLVILGEYNPANSGGPLETPSISLPNGTITDVQFYGQNYDFIFYVLQPLGPVANSASPEQQFEVVASASFNGSSSSLGFQDLMTMSPGLTVAPGDLLAFAGTGPWYYGGQSDEPGSDATYEDSTQPGSFTATPPSQTPDSTFIVGVNPDQSANYEYISDVANNQGRNYSIGVVVAETAGGSAPSTLDHFAIAAIPSPQMAGTPFPITITAQDINGNPVTSYDSSVTFGGTAGVTGAMGARQFIGGVYSANVTPTVAGNNLTVTVTDGAGHTGSATITTVNLLKNLFVSDYGSGNIYKFAPDGTQTTFASGLSGPAGLAFNSAGVLFEADNASGNIYEFTSDGTQTTFASGLNGPAELAFNSAGVLFETDNGSGNIYEFTPAGVQTTFATGLINAQGLAFNSAGVQFVGDNAIGNLYTYTEGGVQANFATGLNNPQGLAFNSAGLLFQADSGSGNIYKYTPAGGQTTFASELSNPNGLAFDSTGVLFVADFNGGNVYEFTPGGVQSTFTTGLDNPCFLAFQPPAFSSLTVTQPISQGATAITLGGTVSYGSTYPAQGETIAVTINGNTQTTTIIDNAGDFSFSYNPSTIPASATPYPITYSYASGSPLIAASDSSTTLTVNPATTSGPTVSVNSATVCAGGSATLTATTSASSPTYLWSPCGSTTASITVSPASTTTYTVTVTDGITGLANSGSGTVTVNPLPTVSVNSATACAGSSTTLTATTSASSPGYLWSPGGATTASIMVSPASTTTYTVTVTDGTTGCANTGSGIVTVNPDCVFGPLGYFGNPDNNSSGGPDGFPPLVILGEYSPAPQSGSGPLSTSPNINLPTGTITDVKFYGGNYNFTFYVLSPGVPGPNNEQTFTVVSASATPFSSGNANLSPGVQVISGLNLTVNAGDLLAFAGVGPYYSSTPTPFDAPDSDATYQSTGSPDFFATPPNVAPGTTFIVGVYGDASADYQYVNNEFGNQGRTYAIGVDISGTSSGTPPTITSITPSDGPASGGTTVTITGTGFESGATVFFGGVAATETTFVSPTSLTAVTAATPAGPVSVEVANPDGNNVTLTSGFMFDAVESPTITSITPSDGSTSGGTTVTITGTGFESGATVFFGGVAATETTFASPTSLTAVTAASPAGPVSVEVANPDGNNVTLTSGFTFVAAETPTITTTPTATAITYGQALSASTLSGGSASFAGISVAGTFAFTTPSTVPTAGTASQSVTFTPADTTDYTTVTTTVSVTVNQATPTITTAPTASAITYGQALSASVLNGGLASTPGTFAFTMPTTAPAAGTPSEGVTFTPTDAMDYTTVTTTINVTVNQALLTISPNPQNQYKTYGQTLAYTTTEFSITSGALVGSDSITGVTLTSGGLAATDPLANYAITAQNAVGTGLANYNISYQTGTLHVTGAPLHITANNQYMAAGTAVPPLTVTYSGFVNNETPSVLGGTPSVTTAATSSSPPGTYTIVVRPGTITDQNYILDSFNGTLLIDAPVPNATGTWTIYQDDAGYPIPYDGGYGTSVPFNETLSASWYGTPANLDAFLHYDGSVTSSAYATVGDDLSVGVSDESTGGWAHFSEAILDHYFEVLGPPGQMVPVLLTAAGATASSPSPNGSASAQFYLENTQTQIEIPGSSFNAGSGNESQGLQSTFSINQDFEVPAGVVIEMVMSVIATEGSASIDPTVTVDPAFSQASQYSVASSPNSAPPPPGITITWPTPADITEGTALSAEQLNATANIAGSFSYSPASGTVLPIGQAQPITLTFTPYDTTDYPNPVTQIVPINVDQITPAITTAPTASAITYGQALSASTLSGGVASTPGTFAFSVPSTTPTAGTSSQSVTFTPADTTDNSTILISINVTVNQATPTITALPTASAISYGQALSASTLSGGSGSVAGSFAFTSPTTTPSAGTAAQSVTFTPTDATDYNNVTTTVSVQVNPLAVVLTGTRGYDGTATAAFGILSVVNSINADVVTVASGSATLAGASVGLQAITAVGTLALGGLNAGNYTLADASGSVTISNSFSKFSITTSSLDVTGTNFVICWQSVPGVTYSVLTNTGLTPPQTWGVAGSTNATTTTTCFTLPGGITGKTNAFVVIKQ